MEFGTESVRLSVCHLSGTSSVGQLIVVQRDGRRQALDLLRTTIEHMLQLLNPAQVGNETTTGS